MERIITASPSGDDEDFEQEQQREQETEATSGTQRIIFAEPDPDEETETNALREQEQQIHSQRIVFAEPDDTDDVEVLAPIPIIPKVHAPVEVIQPQNQRVLSFKAEHNTIVKQVSLERGEAASVSWPRFQQKIAQAFHLSDQKSVTVAYLDSDGDRITVDSDIDLRFLLRLIKIPKLIVSITPPTTELTPVASPLPEVTGRVESLSVSLLDTHPESLIVIDMLVDLVFSNPAAMRDAIGSLQELAEKSNIPVEEIFNTFNEKLKIHVPKETSFSENHVSTCSGITDACRHLHYELAPTSENDLPPSYDYVEFSSEAITAAKRFDGKDKDNFTNKEGLTVYNVTTQPSSQYHLSPSPVPETSVAITTAQLQAQARAQRGKQFSDPSANSLNQYLSRKFTHHTSVSPNSTSPSPAPTPPNSEWSSPVRASSSASLSSGKSSSLFVHHNFASTLRNAIDRASATHTQIHEKVVSQHPWLGRALASAHAAKEEVCATMDTFESVRTIKEEANGAFKWLHQATWSALEMACAKGGEEGTAAKKEVVDRVIRSGEAGSIERWKVEEIVERTGGDYNAVVKELAQERLRD
ncbi:hypothetical protein HK100_001586 [Physocladia obscura]|uniref:PB1 domain-containing protein n=1 Tax=Physocladia obscura TaxID=109957 RepID=A0AAD5SWM0_9FUNG|nr:hypothetical protein HK100_001586 [Physocladia obscura]